MSGSWTFGRRLALGFAVVVVALIAVAITGLRTTQSLVSNDELVAHTHEMRTQLSRLLAALVDAETAERGYVITGSDRYLEPYRQGLASMDAAYESLRQQTSAQLSSLSTSLSQLVQARA
jgi:CHASE3 domain sensor protein